MNREMPMHEEYDVRVEKGSITSAPSKFHQKYDADMVRMESEVLRLRDGNRMLLDELARVRAWHASHASAPGHEPCPWNRPPWNKA